jgi:hypothetical protein
MMPSDIHAALLQLEQSVEQISSALVSNEPAALEAASSTLRKGAIDFSQLLQRVDLSSLKQSDLKIRLGQVAQALSLRRESLIRRSVFVDRALNAVVPASQNATYSKSSGVYGAPGKTSGAIRGMAA